MPENISNILNNVLSSASQIFSSISGNFSNVTKDPASINDTLITIDEKFSSSLIPLIAILMSIFIGMITYMILNKPEVLEARDRIKKLYSNYDKRNLYHNLINSRKNQKREQKELFKVSDKFATELLAADITTEPSEFLLMWGILVLVPAFLIYLINGKVVVAIGVMLICALGPFVYIKKKISDRANKFAVQFGDALKVICNGVQAGLSFQIAMRSVTKNMEDPIASEFERALLEMDYGVTQIDALKHMNERIKNPDLDILISTLAINQKTGGSLSSILTTISDTVKKRVQIKAEVSQLCAQGNMSAIVISGLPILVFIAISIMNPSYIEPMFEDELGRLLLAGSAVMEIIGILIVKKITYVRL